MLLEGMAPEAMDCEDIDDLHAALLSAQNHVRLLQALIRQKRSCTHDWVMFLPSGQRDNGEYFYRCTLSGRISP